MGKKLLKGKNRVNRLRNKISKYLSVFIIILSLTIMIGSTFAYFTDKTDDSGAITFSKVELSDETTVGINGSLQDAIPGSSIVDGSLKFSKSIDSEAIYVRAKVSFSAESNADGIDAYLDALRNSNDLGIVKSVQNGAVWSEKEGNYFYLLNENETELKRVEDTFTYLLSENILVPRDLEQLPNYAQYMEVVNFHIEFQAIQVNNIVASMDEIKELFNYVFPERDAEKAFFNVLINNNNGTDFVLIKVESGMYIEEPEMPVKLNHRFVGWYLKDGSDNDDWGEMVTFPLQVDTNISLFAKWDAREIIATHNNVNYYSIDEAITAANLVNYGVVRLEADAIIESDITINSGVTLFIPYDNTDNEFMDDNTANRNVTLYGNTQYIYRTLTIDNNVTLTNNGTITVGSVLSSAIGGYSGGGVGGMHGEIVNNGIIVNNSQINAYGYIAGAGKVFNQQNSTLVQPLTVIMFRGGGYSAAHYSAINGFSANRYTFENVRCTNRLYYGAKMLSRISLYVQSYQNGLIEFISNTSNGLFQMTTEGYIETKVTDSNLPYDTLSLDFYSDITFNHFVLTINVGISININSSKNYFPFPYDIEWSVYKDFLINNKIKVLTGTKFIINEGATVTANADVIAYSVFNDVYQENPYPVLTAAEFICNGTFTANAGFGGIISSNVVDSKVQLSNSTLNSKEVTEITGSSILVQAKTQTITETARGIINGAVNNFEAESVYTWNGYEYVKEVKPGEEIVASLNGQTYTLIEALNTAVNGDTIILIDNAVLYEDATIPVGVTLLVPYNETYNDFEDVNNTQSQSVYNNVEYVYRTLTINKGVRFINMGTITVGAILNSAIGGTSGGGVGGMHGRIINEGKIVNDGTINAYGYITGIGRIENNNGSSILQPMILIGFRGGTYSFAYYNNVNSGFSINRYTLENIRCTNILYYGSEMLARINFCIQTDYQNAEIKFISSTSDGLFQMVSIEDSYIETRVTDSDLPYDTLSIDFHSDIVFNNFNLTIKYLMQITLDSSDGYFPLPYDVEWNVYNQFLVYNKIKILTGTKFVIHENASVIAEADIISYSEFNDTYIIYPYPVLSAAQFICNGTFTANAGFGGIISSNVVNSKVVLSNKVVLNAIEVTETSGNILSNTTTTQTINETARGLIGGVITNFDKSSTYTWDGTSYIKEEVIDPEEELVASLNGVNYTLSDALNTAVSGDTIVLIKDFTLKENLSINSGVTLLIPYGDSTSAYIDDSTINTRQTIIDDVDYIYRTLTIASGVTLQNNGIISVGGTLGMYGSTNGDYGLIVNNGTITNNNTLNVYGYITGSGLVENLSGAVVNQPFTAVDFRGGTYSYAYTNKIKGMPFNRYTFENLRCPTRYYYGSRMVARFSVFVNNTFAGTDISIIGGLYHLNSGYIETEVVDSTNSYDTFIMKHNGNITFDSFSVSIKVNILFSSKINTSENFMALPCDVQWVVESGMFGLNNKLKVLPGSKIEVKQGATFIADADLMIYTTFNDTNAINPYPSLSAGKFINNGTFVANAGFAGKITSSVVGSTIQLGSVLTLNCSEVTGSVSSVTATPTTQTITESANGTIDGIADMLFNASSSYTWSENGYILS